MRLLGFIAGALLLALQSGPVAASVTVGNNDAGNCYPFSCGPSDGLSRYQEVYTSTAFSGTTTFNTVSFGQNSAGPMDSATYNVSFYLTAAGPFSLSSNLNSNEGTLLGNLG